MTKDNPLRARFKLHVESAIHEARRAAEIQHSGLAGTIREILVGRMLQPSLPPEVSFGTGKLVDRDGELSRQLDVVLYSPHILPPGLYDARTGLFPIESCLYSIEVKSTLNATELVKAIESARRTRELTPTNTFHFTRKKMKKAGTPPPICALFAFDSDLDGKGKTKLDRYIENDDAANPAIAVLCVVGKGYWCTCDGGWRYYEASEYDEVLSFLAGITNTLPGFLAKKGRPQFGSYLIKDTGGTIIKLASQ